LRRQIKDRLRNSFHLKSRINRLRQIQTTHQQSRRNQQDHAHCNLQADQCASQHPSDRSLSNETSIPTTGIFPMPCYCAKQDWHDDFGQRPNCPTYEDALQCTDAGRSFHITTYKNCNYVTVNYDAIDTVDMRVYDAMTHELVGALRGTDSVVSSCGSRPVGRVQSGVLPGPECEVAKQVSPCNKGDVTMDGGDADSATNDGGGCECTLTDAGIGQLPLRCFCDSVASCPSYREALANCDPPITGGDVTIEEYAGCNLSAVRVRWPSVFASYVYDFTTHELVGMTYSARIYYPCGDGGSGAWRAGITTIDPSCTRTRLVVRCSPFGDAGTAD
jgi:hypothetical protein